MRANSGWFGSKMATGYFQDFLSVLQFYSDLIGIKYGSHFSNQVKIKMLFNKELIYWKKYIQKGIFRPKCGRNLIHKCGPQNLMVTMGRPLCCYCKKKLGFLFEVRYNSKITHIKTKGVAICHVNNSGNHVYCRKRLT